MSLVVYVGRFQPFHLGHLKQVEFGLSKADSMLIVIGSVNKGRTLDNPFYRDERSEMIMDSLSNEQLQRVTIGYINDFKSDKMWQYSLNQLVSNALKPLTTHTGVSILGDSNDKSTYYLNRFPYWNVLDNPDEVGYHGTDIRNIFFKSSKIDWDKLREMVPEGTFAKLASFRGYEANEFYKILLEYNGVE